MTGSNTALVPFWPILVYGAFVFVLLSSILVLSFFLGQRHKARAMGHPYESGVLETGSARLRFSAQFYLVAMLFVIFDIEAIFIVLWALAFQELDWPGLVSICIFIGILLAVLIYEWSIGALDFGPNGKKILQKYHQLIKKSAV